MQPFCILIAWLAAGSAYVPGYDERYLMMLVMGTSRTIIMATMTE